MYGREFHNVLFYYYLLHLFPLDQAGIWANGVNGLHLNDHSVGVR